MRHIGQESGIALVGGKVAEPGLSRKGVGREPQGIHTTVVIISVVVLTGEKS